MNYEETCNYLYHQMPMFERQGVSGYKEGLGNTLTLDEHFGHPHQQFRSIHVAGTNGKGSCAHTLAAILQSCGYKVGLYTSPHLTDFSERIRVNGQPIKHDYVVSFVEQERDFIEPLKPSFFEVVTAMAFKYFAEQAIDIAVVEVGLGGRLDCTNIITPTLSIITNIGFDHTQLLGNTLTQIAAEKAGIIKKNVPVVVGETTPETRLVFENAAAQQLSHIIFAEDNKEVVRATPEGTGMKYETVHYGIVYGELGGIYQEKNTNTVLCAVRELERQGFMFAGKCDRNSPCTNREVSKGFASVCELTGLEGRWQKVSDAPLTICDTGHNLPGWQYLSRQLKDVKCRQMHILFGMVDDKDVEGVMALLPRDARYYFAKASSKRAVSETLLKHYGEMTGLQGDAYPDVVKAYEAIRKAALNDDFVFIGGSSYIVADFLKKCI